MTAPRSYRVPDISCDHCKNAIEGEVGALDGIETVHVEVEERRVTVGGDATDEAIRAAIEEAGYEVAAG